MLFQQFVWMLFVSASSYGVLATTNNHAGEKIEVDWSSKVKQFNLNSRLTSPTASELKTGVHNSRRSAHNHIRRGVDEELHRKLIEPQLDIMKRFDANQDEPSLGPRLVIDKFMDPLPFGDGPGIQPGLPEGTKGFWDGGGEKPTKAWEVVACPVADVESFLEEPMRCVYGDGDGTITDLFLSSIESVDIANVLNKAIAPIAVEALWAISPMKPLSLIFKTVCNAIGAVEDVINALDDVVNDIADAITGTVEPILNSIKDVVDTIKDIIPFRRKLSESGTPSLVGLTDGDNFAPCDGPPFSICNDELKIDCNDCLLNDDKTADDCGNCRSCWKPLSEAIPDMAGICLDTVTIRNFSEVPASADESKALFTIILSNYIRTQDDPGKILDGVSQLISEATDIRFEKLFKVQTELLKEQTNEIKAEIGATCSSSSQSFDLNAKEEKSDRMSDFAAESEETDNKKDDEHISEFLNSDGVKNIKRSASKHGISGPNVDELFKTFQDAFGPNASYDDKIKEKMLSHPTVLTDLQKLFEEEVKKNPDKYSKQIKGHLLKMAINPETGVFETERLQSIRNTMASIRDEESDSGRMLSGGPKAACLALLDDIESTVKDFVQDALETIFAALGDDIFATAVNSASGYIAIPAGLVEVMNPFGGGNSGPGVVLQNVIKLFQTIVGKFMFGCDGLSNCKDELPSLQNNVLTIQEARDGSVFMNGGCDSNFEGELEQYNLLTSILIDLLQAASDSVIEFFNFPIIVVRYLVNSAQFLFQHMAGVCAYLDGYVQLAKVEATYENTRYALQELACRKPVGGLKRGYGCDGIDNTCDEDKKIDECDEDIFPPDLDVSDAVTNCGQKIFQTEIDAIDCVSTHTVAKDDCQPVKVDFSITDDTKGTCNPEIKVTAVAQNCGISSTTTTSATIPIKVDGVTPLLYCNILEKDLQGTGVYTDIQVVYDISDDCDMKLDVKVEVFSNELSKHVDEMVFISEPDRDLKIIVQDEYCGQYDDCKISNSFGREYQVQISATDSAGNTGMTACSTFVGTDGSDGSDGRNLSDGSPLFQVASSGLFELVVGTTFAPTISPSSAPSSAPTFKSISRDLCENFAVHAQTTVTFAGVTSTVQGGDVGVFPGTSITGSHQFENGRDVVLDSPVFANHVDAYASAMKHRDEEQTMEIEIGGTTFLPGFYRSGSAINFAHGPEVTLDGNGESNPEFIFIAGSTLVTAADTSFILTRGAKAENVLWVLGTAATLGARSRVAGSIIAGTDITFGTKSELHGCALAQSAVTFESGGSVVLNYYETTDILL